MQREIIVTEDGSHSLFVKDMGETFHSKHGAVQESTHVYIKNGIELIDKETINVLEYGSEILKIKYCVYRFFVLIRIKNIIILP